MSSPESIKEKLSGIYHLSCSDPISWYGFSKYLLKQYREKSNDNRDYEIFALDSKDLKLSASRPKYSFLKSEKIINKFDIEIPTWHHYIDRFIDTNS